MTRYKAFRLKNKKYRNAARKRNYHRGRPPLEKAKRRRSGIKHKPWSQWDLIYLMNLKESDKWIAEYLGRSVQAIQQKRYLMKKESHGK